MSRKITRPRTPKATSNGTAGDAPQSFARPRQKLSRPVPRAQYEAFVATHRDSVVARVEGFDCDAASVIERLTHAPELLAIDLTIWHGGRVVAMLKRCTYPDGRPYDTTVFRLDLGLQNFGPDEVPGFRGEHISHRD